MNAETKTWLTYAGENFASAKVLLENGLYNPCLQNVPQAVEKMLKAVLIELDEKPKRTHSIVELATVLGEKGRVITITEDEMNLLDSVYLPSKYPLGNALPDFEPDRTLCQQCLGIAERVRDAVSDILHWDAL